MKNKVLKLGELLPDNLSEETFEKITALIAELINEEVTERVKLLESKSVAFIRKSIDTIKDQAVKELTEENEIYQNAIKFNELKQFLGIKKVTVKESKEQTDSKVKELTEENKVLIEHLNSLASEVDRVKKIARKYKKGYNELVEQVNNLNEQTEELKDEKKPFKSTEKALMLTEEILKTNQLVSNVANPFLSDDVMALMPQSKGKK
jgi:DNA repair ATPase RecN